MNSTLLDDTMLSTLSSFPPDSDIDLPDDAESRWQIETGSVVAILSDDNVKHKIVISTGCSNFGIEVGLYQFSLHEAIDLIANLADAVQEYLRQTTTPDAPEGT